MTSSTDRTRFCKTTCKSVLPMYGLALLAALLVASPKIIWQSLVLLPGALQSDTHRLPKYKEDNELDTQKFHCDAMVLQHLENTQVSLYQAMHSNSYGNCRDDA